MTVQGLDTHPIILSDIKKCNNFSEWVNGDISNAFYLGFLLEEFTEIVEALKEQEDGSGIELLKSLDMAFTTAKPYLKRLAELMKPYLEAEEGLIILDMVNDVLEKVETEEESDIYCIAYLLGIYTNYLWQSQAEA